MSLDSRAAHAARSLRASVAGRTPAGIPAVTRRQRRSLVTSFGATAAAVLFIIGIASAMPSFFEPDRVGADTSLPGTTVPEHDGAPLVVEPDDKQNDEAALVDLSEPVNRIRVHQFNSKSDSPKPWTKFYGDADPGTVVTAVSDYGSADMVVGEHGDFSLKLLFGVLPPPGEEFPILVTLDAEVYEFHFTSLFDPDNVEVTVHQMYGFSDDAEAFEKFFGSAPPGSTVIATSEYGTADTTVGEDGQWKLKLWFGELPHGEAFDIVVDVAGQPFTFSFISLYEKPPPPLSITQVNSSSESSSPYVQFVGTGPAGTGLLAQSAYGSEDLVIGESGEFNLKLWFSSLPPAGQKFWITVKVNGETYGTYPFTSHFAEAPKDDGGQAEFSVTQWNTESDGPDPWVKFIVTGPVGTQVDILSDYGSASQTLSAVEEYVKLWFSSLPPAGVPFPVTVKINGAVWGTYQFTSWYEETPVPITANATYGSCAEDPPYDIYHGTAPKGTSVTISSPYGSGSTTADVSGAWSKQVFFAGAPLNEPFTVTVTVGIEVFTFGMVVTG